MICHSGRPTAVLTIWFMLSIIHQIFDHRQSSLQRKTPATVWCILNDYPSTPSANGMFFFQSLANHTARVEVKFGATVFLSFDREKYALTALCLSFCFQVGVAN